MLTSQINRKYFSLPTGDALVQSIQMKEFEILSHVPFIFMPDREDSLPILIDRIEWSHSEPEEHIEKRRASFAQS